MSLNSFLTDVANAIRYKKGTTDKINAKNFANEIKNLPSGGADEEEIYNELLRTNFGDDSIVDDKTSYEQGYEAGSADALKDVTTLKGYFDITKSAANFFKSYKGASVEGLIKYGDTGNITNMQYMFHSCSSLTTIPLLDTSNVVNMQYMFYGCSSLTTIPALDTSKVTGSSYLKNMFYGCSSLKTILMYGMKANFDISSSTKFEASDLVTILNNLATITSTRTLTMGATNLAKLTDEQKAIATNKGWTLA
jgi:surface protein